MNEAHTHIIEAIVAQLINPDIEVKVALALRLGYRLVAGDE